MEILSPGTPKRDRTVKLDLYAEAGVREAWLVDPNAGTVEVVSLAVPGRPTACFGGDEAIRSEVLGTLDFAVREIFA